MSAVKQKPLSLKRISEIVGINYNTLYNRLGSCGMSLEQAIRMPVRAYPARDKSVTVKQRGKKNELDANKAEVKIDKLAKLPRRTREEIRFKRRAKRLQQLAVIEKIESLIEINCDKSNAKITKLRAKLGKVGDDE